MPCCCPDGIWCSNERGIYHKASMLGAHFGAGETGVSVHPSAEWRYIADDFAPRYIPPRYYAEYSDYDRAWINYGQASSGNRYYSFSRDVVWHNGWLDIPLSNWGGFIGGEPDCDADEDGKRLNCWRVRTQRGWMMAGGERNYTGSCGLDWNGGAYEPLPGEGWVHQYPRLLISWSLECKVLGNILSANVEPWGDPEEPGGTTINFGPEHPNHIGWLFIATVTGQNSTGADYNRVYRTFADWWVANDPLTGHGYRTVGIPKALDLKYVYDREHDPAWASYNYTCDDWAQSASPCTVPAFGWDVQSIINTPRPGALVGVLKSRAAEADIDARFRPTLQVARNGVVEVAAEVPP